MASIIIKIKKIKVKKDHFSFKYTKIIKGVKEKGTYYDKHIWQRDIKRFKEILEEGYAAELLMANS